MIVALYTIKPMSQFLILLMILSYAIDETMSFVKLVVVTPQTRPRRYGRI